MVSRGEVYGLISVRKSSDAPSLFYIVKCMNSAKKTNNLFYTELPSAPLFRIPVIRVLRSESTASTSRSFVVTS